MGTIFSINTDGSDYQVLHAFASPVDRGGYPESDLVLVGSTLFGTTELGGVDGLGSIFSIHTDGSDYQVLHSFIYGGSVSGLTLVGSTLYGTDGGTAISINTDGTGFQLFLAPSDNFDFNGYPIGDLTLVGSTLYGSTGYGGDGFYSVSDVTNYDVNGPAAAFDRGLTVSLDPDSTDLSGATVAISASTLPTATCCNFRTRMASPATTHTASSP